MPIVIAVRDHQDTQRTYRSHADLTDILTTVILTTVDFLDGVDYIGEIQMPDWARVPLSLANLNLQFERCKALMKETN